MTGYSVTKPSKQVHRINLPSRNCKSHLSVILRKMYAPPVDQKVIPESNPFYNGQISQLPKSSCEATRTRNGNIVMCEPTQSRTLKNESFMKQVVEKNKERESLPWNKTRIYLESYYNQFPHAGPYEKSFRHSNNLSELSSTRY